MEESTDLIHLLEAPLDPSREAGDEGGSREWERLVETLSILGEMIAAVKMQRRKWTLEMS